MGTREPAQDSRGPTSRRVVPEFDRELLCQSSKMVTQPVLNESPKVIAREGQTPTTSGGDVNGAGPLDRAQPLDLSRLEGRP